MMVRLLVLAVVGLVVWAVTAALRSYAAHAKAPKRFDVGDAASAGEAPLLVTFSGPYCSECHEILPRLQAASSAHQVPLAVIDIKDRPELAAKYDVRLTPTTLVVGSGGTVRAGWLGTPPDGEVEAALAAVGV